MTKKTLIECLDSFNRKERYWLLRNCCGKGKYLEIPLGENFIQKLKQVPALSNLDFSNAWWAMDYHIDWLFAAITFYKDHRIQKLSNNENTYIKKNNVNGSQEDFDFIVCVGNEVILIEAKMATGWTKHQLHSKLSRVIDLKHLSNGDINFHFFMTSPHLTNTSEAIKEKCTIEDAGANFIDLLTPTNIPLVSEKRFLKVVRCDAEGGNSDRDHWKIVCCSK